MKLLVGDVLKTKDDEYTVKKILSRDRYMVKKIAKEQKQQAAIEALTA